MAQRQPDECPSSAGIPDWGTLAGQVGQEDKAVRSGWSRGRLSNKVDRADRTLEDVVPKPVKRLAGRAHGASEEPTTGDRSRRLEGAGNIDRSVRIDRKAARCPARVDRVAGIDQAGADEAGVGIGHTGDDRYPVGHTKLLRRAVKERPNNRARGHALGNA